MAKYVILTKDAQPQHQDSFTNFLRLEHERTGIGWWRHMDSAWLLDDDIPGHDASWWRMQAKVMMPNSSILVLQVKDGSEWAAYGVTERFEWLTKHLPRLLN